MSHHRPVRLPVLSALVALAALVAVPALAGCTPGGSVVRLEPPPTPPAEVAELCAALHEELPDTVAGLERTETDPRSELTAAWGGSAIVLRCGIAKPPKMADPRQEGIQVNEVAWLMEPLAETAGGGFRFTTGLRRAYTEVTVDKEHAKDAGMLVGLSDAIAKTVPAGISSY
ncbi:DUF3515 domain-containing protein [Streptomyces venezuelae]|uniref:DUF3515 domain-containing protein n=1 Tax=Streptomyces venezuelae TaxID=54571 RepID=A0A5P2D006_STRVZ|nr:DUF3515 domain-containing protein [Streptomyces venezuelae]QES48033.1 DUF3515 domain-containing protein [Streptomyces venezuelae]